jgi:hypothetical protein
MPSCIYDVGRTMRAVFQTQPCSSRRLLQAALTTCLPARLPHDLPAPRAWRRVEFSRDEKTFVLKMQRQTPSKEKKRRSPDTVEAAGAAVPSSPSPPRPFGADPFEAARRQMEEAFSVRGAPLVPLLLRQRGRAGPGAVPPPAQHRHRYGHREPQQPDQAAGAAAQGRWQQYDSENIWH